MLSLNTRDTRTPTPSKTLSKIPHATAEPRADRGPPEEKEYDEERIQEGNVVFAIGICIP